MKIVKFCCSKPRRKEARYLFHGNEHGIFIILMIVIILLFVHIIIKNFIIFCNGTRNFEISSLSEVLVCNANYHRKRIKIRVVGR